MLGAVVGAVILLHETWVPGATERPFLSGVAAGLLTFSGTDFVLARRRGG